MAGMLGAGAAVAGLFCKVVRTNGTKKISGDEQRLQQAGIIHCRIGQSWLDGSSERKYVFGAEVNSHGCRYNMKSNVCISFVRFCKNLLIPNAEIK
jgi:hypothetical protein